MDRENIAVEANDIAAALDFIGSSIECHASEGRELNAGGVAYLIKIVSSRSSGLADMCWSSLYDDSASDGREPS